MSGGGNEGEAVTRAPIDDVTRVAVAGAPIAAKEVVLRGLPVEFKTVGTATWVPGPSGMM